MMPMKKNKNKQISTKFHWGMPLINKVTVAHEKINRHDAVSFTVLLHDFVVSYLAQHKQHPLFPLHHKQVHQEQTLLDDAWWDTQDFFK